MSKLRKILAIGFVVSISNTALAASGIHGEISQEIATAKDRSNVTPNTTSAVNSFYGVIDGGSFTAKDTCVLNLGAAYSGINCTDTSSFARFGLGYRVTKNVALEIGYLASADISLTGTYTYLGARYPFTEKVNFSGTNLSLVGEYPVNEIFSLVGKAGILKSVVKDSFIISNSNNVTISTDTNYDNTTLAMGIGMQMNISNALSARIMYEDFGALKSRSTGTATSVNGFSVGLLVNF